MSQTIDDLTIAYVDENNVETVKELGKMVLSKGAWATIMYRYQDWDNGKQAYSPVKYSIRRYQKRNDQFWMKSKFNISSNDQAKKIIDTLNQWMAEDA